MKTAMQELIRIMEETIADNRCDIIIARAIKANIKLATELLDKEKEQIVDAFNIDPQLGTLSGETYYTKTYSS